MIMLTFAYPGPRLSLGPYDSLRFDGQTIRVAPSGEVLARHHAARWEASGKAFYRAECEGPLLVRLEGCDGGDRSLGLFEHFCVLNETAYAGREVFAWYYNTDGRPWHLIPGSDRCAAIVLASP